MSEFTRYHRKELIELSPYIKGRKAGYYFIEYIDQREYYINPHGNAAYVYYGYYGKPNFCRWMVPGTYTES